METYLITGGAGFIGSHFVEDILVNIEDCRIVIIDDLSMGLKDNLPDNANIEFIQADISDQSVLRDVFSQNSFDYIIHLAAIASVQDSIIDPVKTHEVNFNSTMNIIEYARKQKNLKRLVFSSSAAVYGENPSLPCSESGVVCPITPYGVDKYASERYVVNAAKLFGVKSTAFRFFNVYGPRQNPTSPYSGVISIFAERFKSENTQITVFGDGEQTRDFIYVKDLVTIVINSFKSEASIGKTYNICTGIETSLNDVIRIFGDITNKRASINYEAPRAGDIRRSVGDNSFLLESGLIERFTPVCEGLKRLFESI